jgi:hypothetical protein
MSRTGTDLFEVLVLLLIVILPCVQAQCSASRTGIMIKNRIKRTPHREIAFRR